MKVKVWYYWLSLSCTFEYCIFKEPTSRNFDVDFRLTQPDSDSTSASERKISTCSADGTDAEQAFASKLAKKTMQLVVVDQTVFQHAITNGCCGHLTLYHTLRLLQLHAKQERANGSGDDGFLQPIFSVHFAEHCRDACGLRTDTALSVWL